jgi:hypothetical protein
MSIARRRLIVFGLTLALAAPLAAGEALTVDVKIPLGDISGRIDHLAYDSARQRLYVAELGNDSVGIVDLRERRLLRTVAGFKEPQGIGYEASTDTVVPRRGFFCNRHNRSWRGRRQRTRGLDGAARLCGSWQWSDRHHRRGRAQTHR